MKKTPQGQRLVNLFKKSQAVMCPNYIEIKPYRTQHWDENSYNIAAVRRGDIWFHEIPGIGTHAHSGMDYNIKNALRHQNIMDIHEFLNKNGIKCSKEHLTEEDIKKIRNDPERNTYNCRYFNNFKCLTFWGEKNDIDFGIVGDIINILNINEPNLTVFITGGYSSQDNNIYLASKLNLHFYNGAKITSAFSNLTSAQLHLIACKKQAIKGFGSYKLKCGMPHSIYKSMVLTGD